MERQSLPKILFQKTKEDQESEDDWEDIGSDSEFDDILDVSIEPQSTYTIRSRNNIPKYLLDLSENAPEYNPNSRSIASEKHLLESSGDAQVFHDIQRFAIDQQKKGHNVSIFTLPTQTEMEYKSIRKRTENVTEKVQQQYE